MLLGPSVNMASSILCQCFLDFLSVLDRQTISNALTLQSFSSELLAELVTILSRLGCCEIPTAQNFKQILVMLASHEFISRPFAAISHIHNGVPLEHQSFWAQITIDEFFSLYVAQNANPRKVLDQLDQSPEFNNPNEECVYGYLQQFIGNMDIPQAQKFLRFVTGSLVCLSSKIGVIFNGLTGLPRHPLARALALVSLNFLTLMQHISSLPPSSLQFCLVLDWFKTHHSL